MSESKSQYKKTFNYLHWSLGYPITIANKIMKRFLKFKEQEFTDLDSAGIYVQNNWDDFMNYYGAVLKEQYKNERKQFKKNICK